MVDTQAAEEGGEEGLAAQDEASASDAAVTDTAARHHTGVAIEEADPVADAVEKKVEAALFRLHFHDAPAALANALALEALPAHKVLVLVDAQTSKARVGVKLVEAAAVIMARGGAGGPQRSWWGGRRGGHPRGAWASATVSFSGVGGTGRGAPEANLPCAKRLVVTAGPRLDYLLALGNKAKVAFPSMQHFHVQLASGTTQQGNRRPAYVHFAHDTNYTCQVPASINALAARAKPGECTRLRCEESRCSLRSDAERNSLAQHEDPQGVGSGDIFL